MPQGESFWNPYRLVPVRESVERSAPQTHERFAGKSGIIDCTLENLTPLFVGTGSFSSAHPPLFRENRYRIVPGSSLKGMLRSLAEIVGGGCFVVRDRQTPVPGPMQVCNDMGRLCITCRMFGAMGRGQNARVHQGKVTMGDAIIQEEEIRTKTFQVLLQNNGLRHEVFYRSPHTGNLDGKSRKLYFHQPKRKESVPEIPQNLRDRAWDIRALLPGHHFRFQVQFTNLTDDEMALLLYVIHLEDEVKVEIDQKRVTLSGPMRHKIGNAKPLGMGSCHIRIDRILFLDDPAERFSSISSSGSRIIEKDELEPFILAEVREFVNDQSPTMLALRKMMVWDENDSRTFHYPSYHWFQDPEKKRLPLKAL